MDVQSKCSCEVTTEFPLVSLPRTIRGDKTARLVSVRGFGEGRPGSGERRRSTYVHFTSPKGLVCYRDDYLIFVGLLDDHELLIVKSP